MDDLEVRIPHDSDAERAVLGDAMLSPAGYRTITGIVRETDFWEPRHRTVWRHVVACHETHSLADPTLVFDSLREAGALDAALTAPYLHTLYAAAPGVGDAAPHARIVADLATRRALLQAGQRIVQRAESGVTPIADLTEWARAEIAAARDERAGVELLTTTVDEFMHGTLDEPDWIVPGLLARGDRFILTGAGGLGKSTLLRQIAVCAAAGIPPLDWHTEDSYDPIRVSLIDCENSDHQLKTSLWPMLHQARDNGTPVEDRLMIGGHGNPIDLLDSISAMSLMRTIEHDKPDLAYIGPVYKLHNGDPDKEVVIKNVTRVLDQIREIGCAVIAEAHHVKQRKGMLTSLEPSGSNVWTWWPEFGRGLRMDTDSDAQIRRCALEHWRIDRVQRKWPQWIEAGGKWPWARSAENDFYNGRAA